MFSIAGIARSGAAVMDGVQHYYKGKRRATLAQQLLPAHGARTAHPQGRARRLAAPEQQGSDPQHAGQSAYVEVRNRTQALAATLSTALATVEEEYQQYIQERFAHWLGSHRHQQHLALAGDTGQEAQPLVISFGHRIINRYLGLSALLSAVAIASYLVAPFWLLTIPLAFYLLWPIYQGAYAELFQQRKISFNVVEAIFGTGLWLTGHFATGGFSLMIYFLIRKISLITHEQVRQKMVDVFGQQPRTVWLWLDGQEVEIPFEQVQTGDLVVVHAGQVIPVDGTIRQGMAMIDQHRLTGESQPAEKGVGDPVFATTVLLNGQIHIVVEQRGQATIAAQITQILEQTTEHQLAIANRGAQLAERAVQPAILASAVTWPLLGASSALAMISSMPGAHMFLAAPLTLLNFLNFASQRSILVKDGRALEILHQVDTIVFDKTGTLTLEQPDVTQIHLCVDPTGKAYREEDVLRWAAAAEVHQPHPIAQAILAAAAERKVSIPPIADAAYEVGYGIKVLVEEKVVRVGSDRFMTQSGVAIPAGIEAQQKVCHEQGHSLVLVAVDEQLVGALELQPTIRPEAKAIIAELHKRGLSTSIISGDQEGPTRKLAQALGIDHYFANVLPQEKAQLVEQLQAAGRTVCFIGDGINDAIALKKAQVSISLRGATTVAIDTAQIVLMDQSLAQLPFLFDLGCDLDRNLRTSFLLSIGTGVSIISGVWLLQMGLVGSLFISRLSVAAVFGNTMLPVLKYRHIENRHIENGLFL
jgi:Cu2+-exporting ATPase